MHPASKRSIFAFVTTMETMLQQIKALVLAMDDGTPVSLEAKTPILAPEGALSEAEEEYIEKMTEAHRQQLVKEAEDFAQTTYASDDYEGFFRDVE